MFSPINPRKNSSANSITTMQQAFMDEYGIVLEGRINAMLTIGRSSKSQDQFCTDLTSGGILASA